MDITEFYNEHFSTTKNPSGTDIFERDYNYRELIFFAKEYHKKQLFLCGVSKRLSIKLKDWDYECGDGCCSMFGTEIALNGKKCDNQYAGGDARSSLEFVLSELGYEVDIDVY